MGRPGWSRSAGAPPPPGGGRGGPPPRPPGLGPPRPPQRVGAQMVSPARPIVFAPDGTSNGGQIIVAAGPLRRLVAVDWLTGRVSVADAP